MFGRKGRHGNVFIFINHTRRYFVRDDRRTQRKSLLIAIGSGSGFDILVVGSKDMLRHRLDTLRTIHFEWHSAPDDPRREDEIWIADGMVRVQMGRKRHPQVDWFECLNAVLADRGVGTAYDTWTKVDEIRRSVDHNCRGRPRTIRVWTRGPSPQHHHLRCGHRSVDRLRARRVAQQAHQQNHREQVTTTPLDHRNSSCSPIANVVGSSPHLHAGPRARKIGGRVCDELAILEQHLHDGRRAERWMRATARSRQYDETDPRLAGLRCIYLTPTATIISQGPSKPDGPSKWPSVCSISAQAALRPASSRPASI